MKPAVFRSKSKGMCPDTLASRPFTSCRKRLKCTASSCGALQQPRLQHLGSASLSGGSLRKMHGRAVVTACAWLHQTGCRVYY